MTARSPAAWARPAITVSSRSRKKRSRHGKRQQIEEECSEVLIAIRGVRPSPGRSSVRTWEGLERSGAATVRGLLRPEDARTPLRDQCERAVESFGVLGCTEVSAT